MGLPFSVDVRPGRPLHDQVVFAVTKSVVTGQLTSGDAFPSVRALSQELGINPNTAQKIVGTLIADWRPSANPARRAAMAVQIERLVVEAKQLAIPVSDVLDMIRRAWK